MAKNAFSTPAPTPPASRRRTLFSGAAAVILGSGITAGAAASVADLVPANTDAELIALCSEFVTLELASRAIYDGPNPIADEVQANAASAPLEAKMDVLLDIMEPIRAVSAAGVMARAKALAAHNGDFGGSFDYPETIAGRLLSCLLRDATALIGSA